VHKFNIYILNMLVTLFVLIINDQSIQTWLWCHILSEKKAHVWWSSGSRQCTFPIH